MRVEEFGVMSARAIARRARWLCVINACLVPMAHAGSLISERVEWNKVPVAIMLKVGTETQIQFPAPVKVAVPAGLKPALRTQSVDNTVYFQASTAFDSTRVIVQTREGAHTYLLDLTASATADLPPALRVVDPTVKESAEGALDHQRDLPSATSDDPVALSRFAAQQLYAPTRLLPRGTGIVRVPVHIAPLNLLRDATVAAVPLIAWRSDRLHVTAVKLTNTGQRPVALDPRSLKGAWLTATFQHNRLLGAGDEADTTVVYLVSDRPFAAARD